MRRTTLHPKETSFNMRIDPKLKEAFTRAAEAQDKPAAQVVRTLMRAYVRQSERRVFEAEAQRQSRDAAALARDRSSDEYAVMREIEADLADTSIWAE